MVGRNLMRRRSRTALTTLGIGIGVMAVGFVFQTHNLIPTLTAAENVEVPMQGIGVPGRKRSARARELLEWVDLSGRMDHSWKNNIRSYSGDSILTTPETPT